MKVVILSAILFFVVLVAVIFNTVYSNIILTQMTELADTAYQNSTSEEVLSKLMTHWDKYKDYFALTASLEDIDRITENLLCFKISLMNGNEAMTKQSYLLLVNSIESVSRFERLSFANIF